MGKLKIAVGPEDHTQGSEDAACTVVEYGDYECPHCAAAHPVVERVRKHFGERLRFVFRNFPLTQIHQNAQAAAEAAEFAGAQGRFWEMNHLIFANQSRLSAELYSELAGQLGLDVRKLDQALRDGSYAGRVRADFAGGVRSGVNGTPTFFINGDRHDGAFDYERLVEAIGAALEAG